MAQRFPSVALLGATGNLGPSILDALLSAEPPFESITILTRSTPSSSTTYPPNVHIKVVDYTSVESLTSALTGVDAVISAVAPRSGAAQRNTIDAAAAAGVKFFIPSEFGLASNDANLTHDFNQWAPKVADQQKLAALKADGVMDYALIFTGLFLDWGMEGFLLDLKNKSVQLWDGGNTPISLTTVASIGRAVVGVLQGEVGTDGKKTEVRVKDINLTQRRLYELAVEALGEGEDGWTVTEYDTVQAYDTAKENAKKGIPDREYAFLKRAVAAGVYGSVWGEDEDDGEALGSREWTEREVVELIKTLGGAQ
ncbi:hypothetical protein B0H63DRAFT_556234 [Podospora didyma]|uniref:NmrA-like domain-containing protein n=1 Tax=Podospora didyma TaxID=330526 RepID=A0AAE0P867_9PEZI|nr:hypothetical protein B0H63DRAFT_556234 [Podospora didyma]